MSATQMAVAPSREQEIIATLKTIVSEMAGTRPSDIDVDATFIEMGAESLFLMQASHAITEKLGVRIPFRALMEEYPTLRTLAAHIDQKMPATSAVQVAQPPPAPEPPPVIQPVTSVKQVTPIAGNGSIEQIMAQQLQIMAQQLEVMRGRQNLGTVAPVAIQPAAPPTNSTQVATKTEEQVFVPYRKISKPGTSSLTEQQQQHLNALIERVNKKTQKSKQLTQEYRPYFADSREVAGFRSLWKEMQYLIIAEQAIGSKIWDVDGNEYLDISMGFGSLLFGHSPDFVTDALQQQVAQGMQLGPQSHLAGQVAKLVCELTGTERVTFCNSGTEAVMTALRLARAVSGRTKIAMFTGSYHGTFDGTLARAERGADGKLHTVPLAPGVPPSMIEDVMILAYGASESLDEIRQHADELAAVLVEPLQSRRPDNRPSEFLQELRRITEQSGTALIFDEVVSGFRLYPGGAQVLFNIKADIVTYGKAVGAGMPIGIIAGKAKYMDSIDGGMWQYGDGSYPRAETTFFVGTFFKHPMVMTAAFAALTHIKNSGPQLQERLNEKTRYLADTLDRYFEQEDIPIRIAHCGSLFRFANRHEMKYMDLFFFHLLEKGIFVWEGRNCFLSTAHTDEDLEFLISKVKETVIELRAGGFLGDAAIEQPAQDMLEALDVKQLPLTEAQKQLWALAQLGDQASRAYNESSSLHLRGPLNLSALRSAIQQLVDRHGALRITISRDGEQQLIHSSMTTEVSVVDLPPQQDMASIKEFIAAWQLREAQEPFDFFRGPLFRANVLRVSPDYHVLALTVHHLISDGWSFGVLLRDLTALYAAACQGVSLSLPAAKQFSEYVQWQSQQQHGPEMDTAEAYWLAQYADSVPVLELPTDRPRPSVQTYNGLRERLKLDASLCSELKQLSAHEQVTLFMTLLAGYKVLLHRLTNQDDIVVGIASAGQASVTGDDLIGYCINLLPVRSRAGDDPSFTEYLNRLKRVLSDAFDNQIYSLPNLIRKLGLTRDPSRPPLVTTTFNLDRGSSHLKFFDLELEVTATSSNSAKFDLFLNITEQDDELVLDMDYNSDLFEVTTIHRWLCHLRTLLKGIAVHPQRRLSELPLMDPQEQQQLLVEWNQTATPYPKLSLSELFAARVESMPDNIAVTFRKEKLTYRELNERANQLAHYLQRQGVGTETLVGVLMERSVEMIVALVGILKAGGAYVPLDPSYPRERLSFMLADTRAGLLLTEQRLADLVPAPAAKVIQFDVEAKQISKESRKNPVPSASAENLAYVIYTSGSTGTPKGISIPQSAVNRLVCNTNYIDLAPADVIAQLSNFSFDAFTFEIWGALLHGAQLSIITNDITLSPLDFAAEIRTRGITAMFLTTALFNVLAREAPQTFKRVKHLLTGGEMADPQSFRHVLKAGPPARLAHVYGPTENTTFSTWHLVLEVASDAMTVPIGRAISNTELYVLDRNYEPVPVGVPGELLVGGAGLARAYLNRPDLTAETFIPHRFSSAPGARLYRTGDLVRYLANGNLEFLGRLDQQVKLRGFRIELAEIEAVLCRHAAVREAIVVAHNDGPNQEKRLVAYVAGELEAAASELRNYLKEYLPEYMIPAAFVLLEKLPLTSNGKVDRKRLPAPETSRPALNESYAAPRTEAERVLAKIWGEVLRVQQVGIHDNFFELGGDSILSVQIIARARLKGLHLTAKQVFYHQTVAELASVVGSVPQVKVMPGQVTGEVELTPVQHWFFAQELAERAHFNMAVMLVMSADTDVAALRGAVAAVMRHHDALRSRFEKQNDGSWRQWCVAFDERDPSFVEMDLSAAPAVAVRAAIEAGSRQWQRNLSLENGPIMRAVYFALGPERGARLLLVVHHLVIDVISWRILLEDLQTAYKQLASGQAVQLRAETSSYQQWAAQLRAYASSAALQEEVAYWTDERRQRVRPIRLDRKGSNRESTARYVSNSLSAELTGVLLREVPRAYNTQISEVLLAALAGAHHEWSGERLLLVDVEGHGREALFDDVDLTRTVGWFTSIYPLLLELPDDTDYGERLKSIKEQVRRVKHGGVGYGVLRYLSADKAVRKQLARQPQSEISFNYLGRYDEVVSEVKEAGLFQAAAERTGANRASGGKRQYLLQMNSSVVNGKLQMSWEYSADMHSEETVTQLASAYLSELEHLIRHCQGTNAGGFTPSDFAEFKWTEADLDDLSAAIKKREERLKSS